MIHCSRLLRLETGNLSYLHYSKEPKAPVIVWNLATECNLSCQHCYAEDAIKQREGIFSTERAKSFIDDAAAIETPALLFSGGEPLLRADIFALGGYAAKKGVYTALSTNGTLITEDAARKIKNARFGYVGISLDGLAKTHDSFRAREGAFTESTRAIDICRKHHIKTGIRFTLTKHNYTDLIPLLTFLAEKKVSRFCLYHVVYARQGRAKEEDDLDGNTKRAVMDRFFEKVEQMAEDGIDMEILTVDNHADGIYFSKRLRSKNAALGAHAETLMRSGSGCSAGRGIVSVDAQGEVHPCQFWGHESLGNITKRSFREIWDDKNNRLLELLRSGRKRLKGRCGRCIYEAACGGCRLRAEQKFSDLWREDPACYLTDEEIQGSWK